jgi:acetyl-CoA C-acetyltransferase
MLKEVVIVAAARTPIGSFMGSLSTIPAPQLGAVAIRGALNKINLDPSLVDEVLMGHVVQSGAGQAPARQAAIFAGIPNTVPCTTVNKVCSSGMKAVMQGAQAIATGDAEIVVAGGMENMSLIPHYYHARSAAKFGAVTMEDGMQKDGLVDAYNKEAMGVCADACATEYEFSREDQDNFAIESYRRSSEAWDSGKFDNEVVPVEVPQRRGEPIVVSKDEEYTNVRMEKIPQLRPAFSKDGTVTAANASTINDGAAALVLMSREKAENLNLKPLATIKSFADAAQEPEWFTTAPAKALPKALAKANIGIEDVDFFEFNEAFSVVGLANMKILGLSNKQVNVNGGAVSLGHPLGCSGARILVTLLGVLEQNNAKLGAAAICNGGGGASAMILERP